MMQSSKDLYQILKDRKSDINWVDFCGQKKLATCSSDGSIVLLEKSNDSSLDFRYQSISPLNGHAYGVNCIRYSPFGTIIASASTDGNIILWNSQTGEQVVKLNHDSWGAIRVCCFSPSSALLASGSDDETLVVWDISTRRKICSLSNHEAKITGCAFTPDSSFLISSSSAGDLKLWQTKQGYMNYILTYDLAHDLGVLGCDFSSQYEVNVAEGPLQSFYLLATCGNDDLVKLWHIRAGVKCTITLSHTLVGHIANVNCCKFSMDGSLLGSASGDKTVIIWDPRTGNMLHRLSGHKRYVTTCAFSEDNRLVASGSAEVIVWNLDQIQEKEFSIQEECESDNAIDEIDNNSKEERESKQKEQSQSVMLIEKENFSPPSTNKKYILKWSIDDVSEWICKIGFMKYCEIFKTNRIDGIELANITHDSLLINLKIAPLGDRNKILRGVMTLKNPLWQQIAEDEQNNARKPSEFCCPILHDLMSDPVVAADGHSYEREAIERWIYDGNCTSPMTNDILASQSLVPNVNLRNLIQKYQSSFCTGRD